MIIYTIGVYAKTEQDFFSALKENDIDTFCDIRQRRGVRGSQYKFVNSKYLQQKLNELGINYVYEKGLAPTREIREKQWAVDKERNQTKKFRDVLGTEFSSCYCSQILDNFDMDEFVEKLLKAGSKKVVLFCVESSASACHRSLLAQRLNEKYDYPIINI